jgi:hypothetical protein
MIDLIQENPISLQEATRSLPPAGRRGGPMHISCLLRWITQGAKAPDGSRVRLEAIRMGGRWITSRQALQRFAEALTPRLVPETAPPSRTERQRERDIRAAEQRLQAAGI